MRRAIIAAAGCLALLLPAPAKAETPTEEQKKAALMEGYRLNGNSMVGWGSIDVSYLAAAKKVQTEPIAPPTPVPESWLGREFKPAPSPCKLRYGMRMQECKK